MRLLHFILSHSIFIALCAVGLCYQTSLLLHISNDRFIYGFIFFSTICSYNFYWLLSKFYFYNDGLSLHFVKKHVSFFIIFSIALLSTSYFLFALPAIIPYAFIGIISTLLYSLPLWPFPFLKKLQRLGFFKTLLLAFTWAYVTTIVPAVSLLATDFVAVFILFAARFCFMLLLCIIFDKRDMAVDKTHGLHSLATDTASVKLDIIINAVFVIYFLMGLLLRFHFNDKPQMFAFLITGAIVWYVYTLSRKTQGYLFYYFLVDGLMIVTAGASYLASLI
jgi:hypothetical protein